MSRISVAIMAHPKRAGWIPELCNRLDSYATVVWDRKQDRWDTGRRAMLAFDPQADYHLVLQDDAVIPEKLVAGLERAIECCPYDRGKPLMMGLYIGRTRPYALHVQQIVDRVRSDVSWITMTQIHWGVGIVVSTKAIAEMVGWCDRAQGTSNYDVRIGRWGEHKGITAWYPWPSLVDHRNGPSLVPGRHSAQRWAHRFIGAGASPLDLDWTGSVADVGDLGNVWGRRRPPARARRGPRNPNFERAVGPWRPPPKPKEEQMASQEGNPIVVARKTAFLSIGGKRIRIQRGATFAHKDHPIVKDRPHLWQPMTVHFPEPAPEPDSGPEPSNEGEKEAPSQHGPAAESPVVDLGAVRKWAQEQGLDVARSGGIKKSIIRQYQSAHSTGE